jgi:hypothetical protein
MNPAYRFTRQYFTRYLCTRRFSLGCFVDFPLSRAGNRWRLTVATGEAGRVPCSSEKIESRWSPR